MGHGADMVLVRVGDDQADQGVPPLGDEGRIGHHDLNLGVLVAPEAYAAVNGQVFAAAAVKVEVHADLARPAQGQES